MNTSSRVIIWTEPPPMDAGAPLPSLKAENDCLWVSYVCRNPDFPGWDSGASPDHPGFDLYCAVLRFDGVVYHSFGYPSDERLSEHPLYCFGLTFYEFHEVFGTPELRGHKGKRHWIITFHDETLEVIADQGTVVSRRNEGEETRKILENFQVRR
jgi:hypothetical protein